MAVTLNNQGWSKSQFRSNFTYKWTPGTPTVSPSVTDINATSITINHGATKHANGTLAITYMNGHTTNSVNSYDSSAQLYIKVNSNSWVNIRKNVKFNTSWVSWSVNKTIGTYAEASTGYLNFRVNNTTTTMNNIYMNRSRTLASCISSVQYSVDNSTWQNSNIFTNLTPNTTYTLYVKATATSATGETAVGYGNVSATTLSDQANIATKVEGAWKEGPAFIKINGTWKEAKTVYIKVNGVWESQI